MSHPPAHCTAYETYHTCNCDCIGQERELASAEYRAETAEAKLAKFKELAHDSLGVVFVDNPPTCECEHEDDDDQCGNCECADYITAARELLETGR